MDDSQGWCSPKFHQLARRQIWKTACSRCGGSCDGHKKGLAVCTPAWQQACGTASEVGKSSLSLESYCHIFLLWRCPEWSWHCDGQGKPQCCTHRLSLHGCTSLKRPSFQPVGSLQLLPTGVNYKAKSNEFLSTRPNPNMHLLPTPIFICCPQLYIVNCSNGQNKPNQDRYCD